MLRANGVRAHRKELKLTQQEFAVRAGVSRSTVQRWERGRSPRRSYLMDAAAKLGVPVRRLLSAPSEMALRSTGSVLETVVHGARTVAKRIVNAVHVARTVAKRIVNVVRVAKKAYSDIASRVMGFLAFFQHWMSVFDGSARRATA